MSTEQTTTLLKIRLQQSENVTLSLYISCSSVQILATFSSFAQLILNDSEQPLNNLNIFSHPMPTFLKFILSTISVHSKLLYG